MKSMETSNYEKMLEFLKEGGEGGGDGASINGLNGTVFTSANAGIFTPTYGGDSKKKKARKRRKEHKRNTKKILNKKKTTSGVEKLDAFVRDMPTTKVSKAIYDKNLPDKTGQFQSDSAATQGAGDTNVDKIDWKKCDIDGDAPTPNSNMNSLNGSLEAATQSTKPQPEDPSVSMQDVPKAVAWQNKTTVQKASPGNVVSLGPQPTVYPPEYHNPQAAVEKKVDPNRFNNVDVKMNDFTDKTKENEKGININAIQNQWGSGNERGEYRRGADKDDIPKDEEDNLEPSESDRVMEEYDRLLASIENNIQKDEGHAVYLALMDGLDDE